MNSLDHKEPDDGRVVYRRLTPDGTVIGSPQDSDGSAANKTQLSPTLWRLLIGFALLLLLVFLLGILSERELDNVKSGVSNRQDALVGKTEIYAGAKDAAERVNNEARLRAEQASHGGLQPPLAVNLGNARSDLAEQVKRMDRLPTLNTPSWLKLREDLRAFNEIAGESRRYEAEGFVKFRDIREDFDHIQTELTAEQKQYTDEGEQLRQRAVRRVRWLWLTALVIAVLVVVGTVAEVQRRFRQVNRSIQTARRERRFSTQILEGMVSAVAAIDARGRIRSANGVFKEVFPGAGIGISVYNARPASGSLMSLEAAIGQPVTAATYFGRIQVPVVTKSHADRTFDVYSSPLDVDGEQGRIITLVDVTDAMEADTVLRRTEALAAVGQASAQLAHEIKNPLGSIRLGVSILRDMTDRADAINTIDLIERGIEHLNKLVVDVTQFSRQRPLTLAPVKLEDLLDVSLMLVEDRVQDKEINVVRDFGEPIAGQWDEDQLTQVFVNLMANGLEASGTRDTLTVSANRIAQSRIALPPKQAARFDPSHEFVRVIVQDTGTGMDANTKARVFEPFYTTKKRGTGLGLAVVKQIIEQHGGGITVESEVGVGTRFIVDLPLRPSAMVATGPEAASVGQGAVSEANA
jgi:signal transduction histidine kinase